MSGSALKVVLVPRRSVRPMRRHVAGGHAALVFLLVDVSLAADFHFAPFGKKIDHGDAHAVQAAGGLIGALFELAAEFQHGHHALQGGKAQVGVLFHGDAAAVVLHGYRAVVVNGHGNFTGVAGHGFVN